MNSSGVDVADVVSWVLSAAALGFGAFAFFRQHGLQARQHALQRRLGLIEEARRDEEVAARGRAKLSASFEGRVTSQGKSGHQFVLSNQGPAARNVSFAMKPPAPAAELPKIILEGHTIPIPVLKPGQTYPLIAIMFMGVAQSVDVELWWEDGTGQRREIVTLSTLG